MKTLIDSVSFEPANQITSVEFTAPVLPYNEITDADEFLTAIVFEMTSEDNNVI